MTATSIARLKVTLDDVKPAVQGVPVDAVMGWHRDRLLTSGVGLFRVVA